MKNYTITEDNKGFYYVDKNNKDVFRKRFIEAYNFTSKGLARVKDNKGWYYINKEGKNAFNKVFKSAFYFIDDIARVEDKKGYYFIYSDGSEVFNFDRFFNALDMINGKAFVCYKKNGIGVTAELKIENKILKYRKIFKTITYFT